MWSTNIGLSFAQIIIVRLLDKQHVISRTSANGAMATSKTGSVTDRTSYLGGGIQEKLVVGEKGLCHLHWYRPIFSALAIAVTLVVRPEMIC
jgi:hypothetical protein